MFSLSPDLGCMCVNSGDNCLYGHGSLLLTWLHFHQGKKNLLVQLWWNLQWCVYSLIFFSFINLTNFSCMLTDILIPLAQSFCRQVVLSQIRLTMMSFHGRSSDCLAAYIPSAMSSPWPLTSTRWPSLAELSSAWLYFTTQSELSFMRLISAFPKPHSRFD